MKFQNKLLLITICFFVFLISPITINAAPVSTVTSSQGNNSAQGNCGENQVNTAIGCISTEPTGANGFINQILRLAIGMSGGLALLMLLYGTFIVTTSAGIPDKLKEGQEIITSAISGLLFIIFSVALLQFIGITILELPGFK